MQHFGIFTKVQLNHSDYKCSFGLSQPASSPQSHEKNFVVSLSLSGFQNMYQMVSKHRPKSPFLSLSYEDVGGKIKRREEKVAFCLLKTSNIHWRTTTSFLFLSIYPGRNGRQILFGFRYLLYSEHQTALFLLIIELYWVWNMF